MGSLSLSAQVRQLNLGNRSNLTDKKAPAEVQQPMMNQRFSGQTMDMREWHGQFSTLGQRRSAISTESDRYPVRVRDMGRFRAPRTEITLAPQNQDMAQLRNWNLVRDRVIAHRFATTSVRTPEGKHFQEMVDTMSLRELNRFQAMRNKTDDGIPVQTAGDPNSGRMLTRGR